MQPMVDLLRALHRADVRAVAVGGVAVVLHGHPRLTADLDLVVDMEPANLRSALEVLRSEGLVPRLPVSPEQFADPQTRQRWREERNLTVFALHDPTDPRRDVDLFAEPPVSFEELWAASAEVRVGDVPVRIAGIDHLIAMKREAGRPQDLADVEALEAIRREGGRDER